MKRVALPTNEKLLTKLEESGKVAGMGIYIPLRSFFVSVTIELEVSINNV